jgi:peptidoglycan-associated lipoprotein
MNRIAFPALAAGVVLVALAACSSTPLTSESGAPVTTATPTPVAPATSGANASGVAPASSTASKLPEYLDPNSPLSRRRSVYFDYDDFSIKPEYVGVVEQHGKYLMSEPGLAIRIEGNADERGSAEYNLALGQKRAEAVQKALRLYGVKVTQTEAVSWGKEHPKALGHDEAAWAENRRVDLVYPKP